DVHRALVESNLPFDVPPPPLDDVVFVHGRYFSGDWGLGTASSGLGARGSGLGLGASCNRVSSTGRRRRLQPSVTQLPAPSPSSPQDARRGNSSVESSAGGSRTSVGRNSGGGPVGVVMRPRRIALSRYIMWSAAASRCS